MSACEAWLIIIIIMVGWHVDGWLARNAHLQQGSPALSATAAAVPVGRILCWIFTVWRLYLWVEFYVGFSRCGGCTCG